MGEGEFGLTHHTKFRPDPEHAKNPRQPTPRRFFHFHSLNGASALNVFMKRNTNAARDRTPSFA